MWSRETYDLWLVTYQGIWGWVQSWSMLPDLVGRSRYWFELGRAIWGGCILYDFYYYVYYYRWSISLQTRIPNNFGSWLDQGLPK